MLNAQKTIADGKPQSFRAVCAAVRVDAGQARIAVRQALTDPQILPMNWLMEGVVGKLAPGARP